MHRGTGARYSWLPSRRPIRAAALAGVFLAAMLSPIGGAMAAKPVAVDPWISLASVNGAARTPTVDPSLGSWVTFNSGYPTNVKNPRIEVLCYQAGALGFGMAGAVDYSFQLGGAGSLWLWAGGEADCTANLFYFGWHAGRQTYNWLASTTFHAGA